MAVSVLSKELDYYQHTANKQLLYTVPGACYSSIP